MSTPYIGPAPVSQGEIDAKLASFDSVPLFMKSLPDDASEDPMISALQSLAHDGTPDEIAQNFKEQGNDYFKGKRYREALGFYTQAIEAKPTDPILREALLCNRAASNLELKNYGSVLKDCSKALSINPKSSKAYYRSSLALIALERWEEAIDCCDRCLAYDPDNKSVQSSRETASKGKEKKDKKEREKQDILRAELEEKSKLQRALQERSFVIITNKNSTGSPYSPHFDPEDPTGQTLIVPAFFVYPQHAMSDVIPHFVEDTTFTAHLENMFPPQYPPPDWDEAREYSMATLVVYAMTHRKRLLKIGKKMTLKDVIKASKEKKGEPKDGLELKDGCLTFVVLPKGAVEANWVEEFKRTRDQ